MKDIPIDSQIENMLKLHTFIIAIVIRNAMEDFHCKHLSDEQMAELNPLIRNAVYTALYASHLSEKSEKWENYIEYQRSMIPPYWEKPKLLDGLKE
ncbi:MAG: hypothetical protein PHS86_11155 [Syntrophaceae bacterium]|nr:hypothetical protein [Syntrophaceae bacterium]